MSAARFILLVVLHVCIYHAGRVTASCDCNLNGVSSQVAPEIINAKLESQKAIIDGLEEKYQKLLQDNGNKLDRLGNAKTKARQATYLISERVRFCGRHQYQCFRSGDCIHHLLGCDGVPDCIDGSDEDNRYCDNPIVPGKTFVAVLPVNQECFPDASSYVKLNCAVTKIERSSHFPQVFQGMGRAEYNFTD